MGAEEAVAVVVEAGVPQLFRLDSLESLRGLFEFGVNHFISGNLKAYEVGQLANLIRCGVDLLDRVGGDEVVAYEIDGGLRDPYVADGASGPEGVAPPGVPGAPEAENAGAPPPPGDDPLQP